MAIFSRNFDLFSTFFIDCNHIYFPNWVNWGSTSRQHIGEVVMSLSLLWGRPFKTWDGSKMVCFGPKMAGLSTLQSGQKMPKRDQTGPTKCFWSFGTPFGPLWSIDKPAVFGYFQSIMDHFWPWRVDPRIKKRLITRSPMFRLSMDL